MFQYYNLQPKKIDDYIQKQEFLTLDASEIPLKLYASGLQNAQVGERYALEVSSIDQKVGIVKFNLVKIG